MKIQTKLLTAFASAALFGLAHMPVANAGEMVFGKGQGQTFAAAQDDAAQNLEQNFAFYKSRCESNGKHATKSEIVYSTPRNADKNRGFIVDASAEVSCQ